MTLKISLLGLSLLSATPALAFDLSYLNPFTWVRATCRWYSWQTSPAQMRSLKRELESLYQTRLEIDNLKRIYSVILKASDAETNEMRECHAKFKYFDKRVFDGYNRDITALTKSFIDKKKEINLTATIGITQLDDFLICYLDPTIEQKEKASYLSLSELPQSWHEKLKKSLSQQIAQTKKTLKQLDSEYQEEFLKWRIGNKRTRLLNEVKQRYQEKCDY